MGRRLPAAAATLDPPGWLTRGRGAQKPSSWTPSRGPPGSYRSGGWPATRPMRSLPGSSTKPTLPLGVRPAWRAASDRPRAPAKPVLPLGVRPAWRAAGDRPRAASSRLGDQARVAPRRSHGLASGRRQTQRGLFPVRRPSPCCP